MRSAVVKSSWFALAPGMRMDAQYWLRVTDQLRAAGHDPANATDEQVKAAIAQVGDV